MKKARRPGRKKPTIRDIATKAGVSETTVSLAFQAGSRISRTTRDRLLRIARELNYVPHTAARELRRGRTGTVGIIVNDITNPFYGWMIRLAAHVVNERGFQLVFGELEWDPRKEEAVLTNMIQGRVEGLILCSTEKLPAASRTLKGLELPYIMVDTCPEDYNGPYVINDAFASGYKATQHLVEMGCTRIAMFDADRDMVDFSSFRLMRKGFEEATRQSHTSISEHFRVLSGLSIEAGRRAFRRLLDQGTQPDGIFALNDLCCFGIMDAADEAGICPGKDLALVGVDNTEISSMRRISLTSISIDYPTMLEQAANLLMDAVEQGRKPKVRQVIAPELIARSSTLAFTPRGGSRRSK